MRAVTTEYQNYNSKKYEKIIPPQNQYNLTNPQAKAQHA